MNARETEEAKEEEEEEKEEEEEEKQMAPGAALLAHSSRWRREAVGSDIEDFVARALTRAAPGGLEHDVGVAPARRKCGMERKSVRWAPE